MKLHDEIEKKLFEKLQKLKESENKEELKKWEYIYNLLKKDKKNFFTRLGMEYSNTVLLELGYDKEDLFEAYMDLVIEEKNNKYKLTGFDLER